MHQSDTTNSGPMIGFQRKKPPNTMNDTALATVEPTQAVIPIADNPGVLMRQATDVAGVCREIVLRTACNIQGRKYVKCEGWMAIATAHGCIASSRSVERVEGGWTAIGEIRRIADGVLLSQAEGFVGKDEKRWGQADEYACRAMAQTRAISRACRAAFAHVVVLIDGGLSTTPAEEVPDGGFERAKFKPVQVMPHLKPTTTALAPAPRPTRKFKSEAERNAAFKLHLEKCRIKLASDLAGEQQAALEFFQKTGLLLPNETELTAAHPAQLFPSVPVAPADKETDGDWWARVQEAIARDVKKLKDGFAAFQRGDQIEGAEVPEQDAQVPHDTDAGHPAPAAEPWYRIVVPVPRRGQKRDEYLKAPDTIGSLFEQRHGTDEDSQLARQRLWGFVNNYEPKGWIARDGSQMPPSKTDVQFREALDAFQDWFTKHHPDEKL